VKSLKIKQATWIVAMRIIRKQRSIKPVQKVAATKVIILLARRAIPRIKGLANIQYRY